jgi:hypothetical protein
MVNVEAAANNVMSANAAAIARAELARRAKSEARASGLMRATFAASPVTVPENRSRTRQQMPTQPSPSAGPRQFG